MFRLIKYAAPLLCLPFLGGCEYAVQTWVFTPDVKRDMQSQCYETAGLKLVPWANEIESERKLKPLFKQKHLSKAQQKELIYSRISKEEMEDEDPLNPRHIGFVTIGLQNPISIPFTAMISATELPKLKKEHKSCLWKVTVDSALQNVIARDEIPLSALHISKMGSEEEVITHDPEESGVFLQKHPEDYIPQ